MSEANKILKLVFNQTNVLAIQTLLFVGTTKGYRVIRVEDGAISTCKDKEGGINFEGGFVSAAPMFSTQLLCLVGCSLNVGCPPNIVYLWDEYDQQMKGEIRFRSEVKNVLVRRDHLIVILDRITYVYQLNNLKPIASIQTVSNPNGVGAISYHKDNFVIATLDTSPGSIRVEDFYNSSVKKQQIHENPITIIALDFVGRMGATASEQGTIIRVFDCTTLEVLYELRRGTAPARISSIAFSPELTYLIVASDHSTIHMWKLQRPSGGGLRSFMTQYLPNYFQFDRSLSKINLPTKKNCTCPYTADSGPILGFASETDFFVAHQDGRLYHCTVNLHDSSIDFKTARPFMDE